MVAKDHFYQAYQLWNGKGNNALAAQTNNHYDNYKLALLLYASKVLNLSIAENKLWNMQQVNGGITSLADLKGNPIGSANAETTSMALLPYNDELIFTMHSLFAAYQ